MPGLTPGGDSSIVSAEVLTGEDGVTPLVRLMGEMDLSSVDVVHRALDEVIAKGPDRIVFDLAGLSFMDSSGIALLLTVAGTVGRIEVHNPSRVVRQVIEMTGLSETLVIT